MEILIIAAAICYLVSQIKADTSMVRMVIAIIGLVLWLFQCAGMIRLPSWLLG